MFIAREKVEVYPQGKDSCAENLVTIDHFRRPDFCADGRTAGKYAPVPLVAYLLARNIRYEEDLVDQLFNSSEKRLARVLLLLARFGKESKPETVIPKISQEVLAERRVRCLGAKGRSRPASS